MRLIRRFLRNAAIALILTLSACGAGEKSPPTDIAREASTQQPQTPVTREPEKSVPSTNDAAPEQLAPHDAAPAARIVLKPPYAEWKWDQNDSEPRISLENAIWAVTQQAGINYDRKKSLRNAGDVCKQWVHPAIQNDKWQDAVRQILIPFNLTYVMENNSVVLMKAGEVAKYDQAHKELAQKIAKFVSANKPPPKLQDAVIVFPLLDQSQKTTELGTLLSELGMMKAVYVPNKVLNLHVPWVMDIFDQLGYGRAGKSITETEANRIKKQFNAKDWATGTLQFNDQGRSFSITLKFLGEHGTRQFSTKGPRDELSLMPEWIARCAHEYEKVTLSPTQEQFRNTNELRSTTDLFNLETQEGRYRAGEYNRELWNWLVKRNPNSAFVLYRYCLMLNPNDEGDDSLDFITLGLKTCGNHDLMKFLEARHYGEMKDYENSASQFLELLHDDFQNDVVYSWLDECLLALGLGESAAALHDYWTKFDSDSYLPFLAEGIFYKTYAAQVLGGRWAHNISDKEWKIYRAHYRKAEEFLSRAYELNPTDPRVATEMIEVSTAMGYVRDEMEKWFNRAIEADPSYYDAYSYKLTYLMPKYRGSRNEMFAFARQCAANPPKGSRVAMILVDAHYEMAQRSADMGGDWRDYYRDPEVWKEIKSVYEKFLLEHSDSIWDRNYYAKYAFFAHDYKMASRQFDMVGRNIENKCWGSKEYFYQCKRYAARMANEGAK